MPLGRLQVRYLLELKGRYPDLRGKALCLGVPDHCIGLEFDWVRQTAAGYGAEIHLEASETEFKDYRDFFRAIGFEYAASLDISDYEGAEHLLDLNDAITPAELVGRFDLIVNHGTLEQVFHIPNALTHVSRMLRPGGVGMHLLPVNNFVDHGYYQFSPLMLWDYYGANRFEVLDSVFIFRETPLAVPVQVGERPFNPYAHPPGHWVGTLGAGLWALMLVVRKVAESTEARVPHQGTYPWAARG